MKKFIVIGITDNPSPWFPPEVMEVIRTGKVFSGGKRHHEIVAPLLPEDARWIDITVPLDAVFEQYKGQGASGLPPEHQGSAERGDVQSSILNLQSIIVFASGDPLFFGFANTIRRKMPDAEIVLYPTFNSLQMLAHKLVMPYHDLRIVSLTGRPWQEFDKALIEKAEKMGILTDKEHTPAAIAQRMMDYGYTHYNMYVGEHLGNPELERVTSVSLEEASAKDFSMPNCVILRACCPSARPFGIMDREFALLDGREKMITKMPIRLLTLQALELPKRHVLWDIGFCTGSISIEAKLQFPHLRIEAFEIRPECEAIIKENARRHGAPGINIHIGDFLACQDIATCARPDAVFIGGHGGHLKEIMEKVLECLAPDGCIVMNSVKAPKVTTDSHQLWDEACRELSLTQEPPTRIILNDNHPIEILKCRR